MIPPPTAFVVFFILVIVGAIAFFARPRDRLHQALGAFLVLRGATTLAYAGVGAADTAEEAATWARVLMWYTIPGPLLETAILLAIVPLARPMRQGLLGAAAAATLALLGVLAARPELFVGAVVDGGPRFILTSGPWLYPLAAWEVAMQAAIVVVLSRATANPLRGLLALAFAVGLLHAGGFFLVYAVATFPSTPLFWLRAGATLAAAVAALAGVLRLARAPPVPKGVLLGGTGLLVALGVADGLVVVLPALLAALPGFDTSVLLVRGLFALLASFAILRYGLADARASERRRLGVVLAAAISMVLGLAVAGLLLATLGTHTVGQGAAFLAGVGTPLVTFPALARTSRTFAARLLLPPDDPRALAARARTYAAAVEAARGPDGRLLPEGERLLADLQHDLGISAREHALLVRGLESRGSAPDGHEDARPDVLLGRYRVERELGRGATGTAHLALDLETQERVVVKRFLGAVDAGRVLDEARALVRVRHPRIVAFHAVDRRDGEVFLVMAYAPGGSAADLLAREGPLPPARAARLVADALEGLEALHARGLLHRDVKCENLLLDAQGRAMVADMGSVRHEQAVDATLTGGAAILGSLATVAPEVLLRRPASPASDTYAAGAVLYRLLTGEHYVDLAGVDAFEARERILHATPRLPHPRIPPALAALLVTSLAKAQTDRFATARALREALLASGLLEDEERAADAHDVPRHEGPTA